MNVGELRIRLESMDPEAEVLIQCDSGLYIVSDVGTDNMNFGDDDYSEFIIVTENNLI